MTAILQGRVARLLRMRNSLEQLRDYYDPVEQVGSRRENADLHHDAQPFRGAGDAGVEPPGAAVLERKALVEQNHVVPLRALRFVHRQHVAVVEFVIGLALLPWNGFDRAAEAVA